MAGRMQRERAAGSLAKMVLVRSTKHILRSALNAPPAAHPSGYALRTTKDAEKYRLLEMPKIFRSFFILARYKTALPDKIEA